MAEKKTEAKERLYRVFMAAPDAEGDPPRPNRTMELMAKSPDSARKAAERQAYDIATSLGQNPDGEDDAYVVVSVDPI